ncbi:MAG: DNA mismatch repair endonuclease MutL [Bacillota bacterium]
MGKIIILDENTSNKIAAGEVIERPASVVKELVENSIDAGATIISVEIRGGGIKFIRVTDNGSGIEEDDAELSFERHATSKIRKPEDLENITTMGFRGEALASISAVSSVLMLTRTANSVQGTSVEIKGGRIIEKKPAGCPVGTSITVRELFYNTPARYKFLKKDSIEANQVADVLSRIALGRPDISFRLTSNGETIMHTPGNGDLKSAVFCIYGSETSRNLLDVNYSDEYASVRGFAGKAEIARSNRNRQLFFVNGRNIRNKIISSAVDAAYATFLMKNRHPFVLLDIMVNPAAVDVNVHPTKMEVKFSNEQDIYRAVYHAVNNALILQSGIRTVPERWKSDEGWAAHTSWATRGARDVRGGATLLGSSEVSAGGAATGSETAEGGGIAEVYETATEGGSIPGDGKVSEGMILHKDVVPQKIGINTGLILSGSRKCAKATPDCDEAGLLAESGAGFSLKRGMKIIGQAFNTYVLIEGNDEIYLLDQHAAHERIRYEELKKAYEKNEVYSQVLIDAVHVELTAGEYRFAMEEAPFFEKLGFTYESFGRNSLIIRSVPYMEDGANIKELFMQMLDFAMNGKSADKSVIADEVLYRIACRSAVKANKKLDEREIEALLERLGGLENPYTCPHGRPVLFRLGRYELEKLFKRIV